MKYSALDSNGKIRDIVCTSDNEAISIAKTQHYQCLIQVRSFVKSSPIKTLLPFKKEGY